MMVSVTTGWGNEEAQESVRRSLRGGPSGRFAVFAIAAAFLAVGIYGGNLLLSVIAGVATIAAAAALVRAIYDDMAVRRMERRHRAGPDAEADRSPGPDSSSPQR